MIGKMIVLYFSGTGNSKFIAEQFAQRMDAPCYTIEASCDFDRLFTQQDTIAFVYPIYGSRAPKILREFIKRHSHTLTGKRLIIFCTQACFSGDGARSLTDLQPFKSSSVIYAAHFIMPNNINNLWCLPKQRAHTIKKMFKKATLQLDGICRLIKAGKTKRRGFTIIARMLGLPQGLLMPILEEKFKNGVHIDDDCTHCGLCVSVCPMRNLVSQDGRVTQKGNCTLCYRCINLCPQKALHIILKSKAKWRLPS